MRREEVVDGFGDVLRLSMFQLIDAGGFVTARETGLKEKVSDAAQMSSGVDHDDTTEFEKALACPMGLSSALTSSRASCVSTPFAGIAAPATELRR